MITDLTVAEQRKGAFSLVYLSHNIGFALGPMIAGFLFNRRLVITDNLVDFRVQLVASIEESICILALFYQCVGPVPVSVPEATDVCGNFPGASPAAERPAVDLALNHAAIYVPHAA